MKILFDKGSSQVQVHLETGGRRLSTLFAAVEQEGWEYEIGPDRITSDSLVGVDCLAILTRHMATKPGTTNPFPSGWDFAFTVEELDAILGFNQRGGGVLLISNHGPFRAGLVDWTVNDRVLAAELGVAVNPAAYQSPTPPLTMEGSNLNPDLLLQETILAGVTSIVPNNSCAISSDSPSAQWVAKIPSNARNTSPIFPNGPDGQSYAVVVSTPGRGLVLVGGNSGIAGDADSDYPGPGRIGTGSNKRFLINTLRYCGAGGLASLGQEAGKMAGVLAK